MYAMPMIQSAAEMSVHTAGADDEMTEYTNSLRNGILEAYSGIFQGFKNSPKTQLLISYAPHILQFLDSIYMGKDMDEVVMKTAIGVLGDLADTLGSNAGSLIQQSQSCRDFLNECLSSEDNLIKNLQNGPSRPSVVPFLFEATATFYIPFVWKSLHAFGCVELGHRIACAKSSPFSDNRSCQ
ncbi:importin subunit beta-1 [Prunus yedoensis var. nudiflora]|uniref:Importin subunit beta-1 n=1 Tax=Prunus yedoensis var. nudiflora TaxID=2094558 RepID=A0A314YAF7_PRUYE|nr:importin subunit beta-1 [Prunus yedoensis var. nudiflora]